MRPFYLSGLGLRKGSALFRLRQSARKRNVPKLNKEGKPMRSPVMTIARSCEEGMYILREDDCLWRVHEDGMVDCFAKCHSGIFKQLAFIQQCRTSTRSLLKEFPQ